MAGETSITIIGNLTADPELRFTPGGDGVANFTIASTPRTFDRQSNEWKDGETLFMRCAAWRELSENVAETLLKGMRVVATGKLKPRSYETKEGEKRNVTELEIEEIGPSLRYATAKVERTQRNGNQQGGQQGGFGGQQGAGQGYSQQGQQGGFGGGQQAAQWGGQQGQQGGQQWGGQQGQQGGQQWGGQQSVAHYQQAAAAGAQPATNLQEDPWATPGGQGQGVQPGQHVQQAPTQAAQNWGGQQGQQGEPPF